MYAVAACLWLEFYLVLLFYFKVRSCGFNSDPFPPHACGWSATGIPSNSHAKRSGSPGGRPPPVGWERGRSRTMDEGGIVVRLKDLVVSLTCVYMWGGSTFLTSIFLSIFLLGCGKKVQGPILPWDGESIGAGSKASRSWQDPTWGGF